MNANREQDRPATESDDELRRRQDQDSPAGLEWPETTDVLLAELYADKTALFVESEWEKCLRMNAELDLLEAMLTGKLPAYLNRGADSAEAGSAQAVGETRHGNKVSAVRQQWRRRIVKGGRRYRITRGGH